MYKYLAILFMIPFSLFCEIKTANGWEEAFPEIARTQRDTLVVFDVDYTLVYPKDPAHQLVNYIKWKEIFQEENWSEEEKEKAKYGMILNQEMLPLSPLAIEAFNHLKARGIHAMALTGMPTGLWEGVNPLFYRREMLNELGFDFEKTAPFKGEFVFEKFPSPLNSEFPQALSGIVATDGVSKGNLLTAYLQLSLFKPTQIVAIDDSLEQLKQMEAACQEIRLDFLGIHLKKVYEIGELVDKETFREEMERLRVL